MKRMGIAPEMRLAEALELYPQAFPLFKQLGMCCVNPDNENLTVRELCESLNADADSFLDAVNSVI